METTMKVKRVKPTAITANEMYLKLLHENENISTQGLMIAFAKQKVAEALHETSLHFKNPENVSHVKNHYKLDKIV